MKLTYATTPAKTSNPTKNPFAAAMKKSRRRYPFIIITNTATVHASFYKDSKTDSLQFTLQQQTKMKKKKKQNNLTSSEGPILKTPMICSLETIVNRGITAKGICID